MKKIALVVLLMVMTFTMMACGGGGGGGSDPVADPQVPAPQVLTGQFVDAPVEGLTYTSGATTGKTAADGIFKYESGQTVSFKVGDITLGTSQGKSIVTPLDLIKYAKNDQNIAPTDQMVVNMVRFLMTITGSNSNSQTFTIDQATFNNCVGKAVDFDQATGTFSLPGGITTNSLTSTLDAETHFNNTLAEYKTKFSSAYLNGKTLFEVSPNDSDNNPSTPDVYEKGTLKFTSTSAGAGDDSNFIVNPTTYNFTYTVDAKGILQLNFTGVGYIAYLKIIDESADRLAICWEDTYAAADSCLVENEYLYFDETKAQTFFDSKYTQDVNNIAFTQTELISKSFYPVYLDDHDNNSSTPDIYVGETLSFSTSTSGIGSGSLSDNPSDFSFSYSLSNGILAINVGSNYAYIKKISSDSKKYEVCFMNTFDEANNCTSANEYMYLNKTDAQEYIDINNYVQPTDIATDIVSGLTWQKQDDGIKKYYSEAESYCNNLELENYIDWRVPTKEELLAAYKPGFISLLSGTPYISGQFIDGLYWTSSLDTSYFRTIIGFTTTGMYTHGNLTTGQYLVRCVRP